MEPNETIRQLVYHAREALRLADYLSARQDLTEEAHDKATNAMRSVQRAVSEAMGIPMDCMLSKDRHAEVVLARHTAIALCKEFVPANHRQIAQAFRSGMSYNNVISAIRRIKQEREQNPEFRAAYENLRKTIKK